MLALLFPLFLCWAEGVGETCEEEDARVLILINSACSNTNRRAAIRRTWLSGVNELRPSVVVRFIVGQGCEDGEEGETLMVPIRDEYRNNILKLLHALKHFHAAVTHGLESFDYVLKADDDSFVNVSELMNLLSSSPRNSHYRGLFFTGKPFRDPSHKNFVSPRCLPLPVLPPFAYGGGFIMSWDLVDYIVRNQILLENGLIRDKDGDLCCDLDDLQVGIWMFALGVVPFHEDRFNGLLNCHSESVILYDVPDYLMREVHEEKNNDGGSSRGVCNDAVHRYVLESPRPEYKAVGLMRLILLRRWEFALDRANLESSSSHNAHILLPLISTCISSSGTGPTCDYLVDIVDVSIRKLTEKIQTPRIEDDIRDEVFGHISV
ncbi:hypothetical protein TrVE_jg4792 [Triparma verrucosa]|uniref:Hexosyltransferase n=1 Tax=Triparma verrucosa TaxID=1606542 RepID=A0A9W7BKQ4_9STRA|nr:hypothetical protein TrVE_jg4792 [Triparma verrucosa]